MSINGKKENQLSQQAASISDWVSYGEVQRLLRETKLNEFKLGQARNSRGCWKVLVPEGSQYILRFPSQLGAHCSLPLLTPSTDPSLVQATDISLVIVQPPT